MRKIQLLYAANEISRKIGFTQQELSFFVLVENLAFFKQIDILWAGEDGVWHTLPATYHSMSEHDKEYWNATATFHSEPDISLPGNVQFVVRYRVSGKEYWDNNHHLNYRCPANSCIQQAGHHSLLNIGFTMHLNDDQKTVPLTVAINHPLHAKKVSVHWTTDDWKTTNITRCYLSSSLALVRGEKTTQDGAQIWKARLIVGQAYRIQYSICCESDKQVLWDNNATRNYSATRKPLNVLVLNLHCYQERNQDYKFSQIAKAINELSVDVVCFQEVAENWNNAKGDWPSNSAKIINDRLESSYHLHTDWSHLGFDRYREGVAILTRYPIARYDSKYVSNSSDPYNIHARKVVMAQIAIPFIGLVNVFSAHLSWWEDGFAEQFENLRGWAAANQHGEVKGTLLCGDFNIKAGSRGYEQIVNSNEYEDQYLGVRSPNVFEKIFHDKCPDWQHYLVDDHRIDYIFKKKSSAMRVTSGRVVFTNQEYGRVSDHEGYLMTFEPT
jgi:maltose 6'-phosphate phosphatase